uniref:Uncharacterized protein n=1 Tax=Coccidioides posadasii RMSCC 3488 TaxID=454284 RepID=A0A0J6FRU5_COCPO|nr:hypothetical protein CPAG_08085 [Coccidioides posadasii RMSCC 3488]
MRILVFAFGREYHSLVLTVILIGEGQGEGGMECSQPPLCYICIPNIRRHSQENAPGEQPAPAGHLHKSGQTMSRSSCVVGWMHSTAGSYWNGSEHVLSWAVPELTKPSFACHDKSFFTTLFACGQRLPVLSTPTLLTHSPTDTPLRGQPAPNRTAAFRGRGDPAVVLVRRITQTVPFVLLLFATESSRLPPSPEF